MTRRKVLCRGMPEPRLEAFPGVEFLRVMFPEMERLLHCNQGFIANLVLTLKSELLYGCSRFLALALRSQRARLRKPEFSHPVHFWQTGPNRLQYGRDLATESALPQIFRRNSQ
jgi:hypothetical protein